MLIASRTILETLWRVRETNQVAEFTGIYDATQMEQTIENWRMVPHNNDLIPLFQDVVRGLSAKHSAPYTPTSKHNFMHNKVLVVDDAVLTVSGPPAGFPRLLEIDRIIYYEGASNLRTM